MFTRVVTKNGDVFWLRNRKGLFGRAEIAELEKQKKRRRERQEAFKRGIEL